MPKKQTMTLKEDFNRSSGCVYRVTFPKQFVEANMDLIDEEFKPKRTLRGNIKLIRVK